MRSLDGDGRAGGELPDALLGNKDSQNTGLVLRLDVLRLDVAHEEAAGASSGVTLLTQNATLLILIILVQTLLGTDGQIGQA